MCSSKNAPKKVKLFSDSQIMRFDALLRMFECSKEKDI